MKINISSFVFTLTVFLNSIELSWQAENGHNLDLDLRLGIGSRYAGSSLQNEKKAENERGHGVVRRAPLVHGSHLLPLRRKADADLSLSLAPPGHKVVRLNPNDKPGISGLPRGFRYPVLCGDLRPDCIFYEAAPKDYRLVEGPLPVVVRGRFIIGRFDHGYLRPIFNNLLQAIKIGRTRGVPFHAVISEDEMVEFGMNKPISPENTINYRPPFTTLNENQHN